MKHEFCENQNVGLRVSPVAGLVGVMLVPFGQIGVLQTNLNRFLGSSHFVALHLAPLSLVPHPAGFSKKAHFHSATGLWFFGQDV